jgi:2-C-methyl-D-erythritol 4-phosphate cytidylyltransferase
MTAAEGVQVGVVIPAAGAGRRMGGPKAFLEVRGVPALLRALLPFLARHDVAGVTVALSAEDVLRPPAWLSGLDPRVHVVAGGAERSDSVAAALLALPPVDVILIHDAARPLVSAAVIDRVVRAAAAGRCVVPVVAVTDTIQQVDGSGRVIATPARDTLRAAQTPQGFPAPIIREAHRRARLDGMRTTDDAALVAHYGADVFVVEGDVQNLKLTTAHDVRTAEAMLDAVSTAVPHP